MKKLFCMLVSTFAVLLIINISWIIINLFYWASVGIQDVIVSNNTLFDDIYYSSYFKWIVWADVMWWILFLIFAKQRKGYKSDLSHYLNYNPISSKKICVTMHTYNEEPVIEKTVKDFVKQDYVEKVIVIDNHSTDRTVELARESGATVITKTSNKGYAHSWCLGLREALKTDASIIVITDADGTYNGYDIKKMIPYLDNCDMVIGTRMTQVLSEKANQNDTFLVWGNLFIATFFQLKYFNLRHFGVAPLSDVGCSYRCIRRESLEKIIGDFTKRNSDELEKGITNYTITLFTTKSAIENDLRVVEVPITFKERLGISKGVGKGKNTAITSGLQMLYFLLFY